MFGLIPKKTLKMCNLQRGNQGVRKFLNKYSAKQHYLKGLPQQIQGSEACKRKEETRARTAYSKIRIVW